MLNIAIRSNSNYIIGNHVIVEVTVANVGDVDSFFHMPTSSSGGLRYDAFSVRHGNNKVIYHGIVVKTKDFSVPIHAGEEVSFNVDLTREYLINKDGIYTLTFNSEYFNPQHCTCNAISINMGDHGLQPIPTWYQSSSLSKKSHSHNFKAFGLHKVYDATEAQFSVLKQAHEGAKQILNNIESKASETSPNYFAAPYAEMFCRSDIIMWPLVYSNTTHMNMYMNKGLEYHFNGDKCNPGDYAYVYKNVPDTKIYLCDMYNAADLLPSGRSSYDTKAGVIIHEVSHKAVNSEDHFYGYAKCKTFADSCDTTITTTNADCLQIFSELCFLSGNNPEDKDDF